MALTAQGLAAELGVTQDRATELLGVVTALVNRYAPDAPEAVQDEAALRAAGYLNEQPGAAITSESTGDEATRYAAGNVSALRHSGAMALLSPWKARLAGVIG